MQLQVTLAPGSRVDQLSRVIARLHAARAEPESLSLDGDRLVLTLADPLTATRVSNVLVRIVDVLAVERGGVQTRPVRATPLRRTTYVPYIRPVNRVSA